MRHTSYLLRFLLIFSILFSVVQHAYATVTVTRGPQSPTVKVAWDIVGGSGTCAGTTNYPNTTGDGVKTDWETGLGHSPAAGTSTYAQINKKRSK